MLTQPGNRSSLYILIIRKQLFNIIFFTLSTCINNIVLFFLDILGSLIFFIHNYYYKTLLFNCADCMCRGAGINRYEILLKVESPGHYVGCVKYEGAVIGPSSLNTISLSGEWAEYNVYIIGLIIISTAI